MNDELNLIKEEIFGNEAGEEEDPEVLNSYFVNIEGFDKFWNSDQRLAIVKARKGLGKSTLLSKLNYDKKNSEPDAIVSLIKGSDLMSFFQSDADLDPSNLINNWQSSICKHLNCKIGEKIDFALDDTKMSMVEIAELAGYKGRSLIGSLIDRIRIKLPLELERREITIPDPTALLKRFDELNDYKAWILIDDIDATFINNQKSCLQISTFLSCCRKMVTDFRGISIRVSIRSDVWSVINRVDEALDKCEQYITEITWDQVDFSKMLAFKIHSYFKRKNILGLYGSGASKTDPTENPEVVIRELFASGFNYLGELYTPSEYIYLLTDGRPRWAINLCKRALRNLKKEANRRVIGSEHFDAVLKDYGKSRLADLYKEYGQQFPKIENLIQLFLNGSAYFRTEDLLYLVDDRFIKIYPNIEVEGSGKEIDCVKIAHFLYQIGFISANKLGRYNLKNLIRYVDKVELLRDKHNLDHGLTWLVNPIYQEGLNLKKNWPQIAPKGWKEEFFHPQFNRKLKLLHNAKKEITVGELKFVISVIDVGYKKGNPAAHVSIKEVGREEWAPKFYLMYKDTIIAVEPKAVKGIIYFFEVLGISNNPKMVDLKIYNEFVSK